MAEKARLFGDTQTLDKIIDTDEPEVIKWYRHSVKTFKRSDCICDIEAVLTKLFTAKFGQNEDLCKLLKSTGTNTLAEANPYDKVYGIGLSLQEFSTGKNDHDKTDLEKYS